MTTKVRALLGLMVVLTCAGLPSCGHYTCGTTFGNATCNASNPGIGGGGPSGAQAFAYYVGTSAVGAVELSGSNTVEAIPNFVTPALPNPNTGSDITIASKKFLYLPFANTSQLFAWSIDSSGGLTPLAGSPFSAPWAAGLPVSVQTMSSIIVSPDGNFLFAADATSSEIVVFQIDPTTGALTSVPGSPFSTAGLVIPFNLAMDGLGRFLYVMEGNGNGEGVSMAVFIVNNGVLSSGTALAFPMWQVQGERNGKFMIGTRDETGTEPGHVIDTNLHVFSINQATGVLTETATSPVPTPNGPTRIVIHPNGKFVYDFNISLATNFDGPVDGFQLDSTTGALTPIPGSPFASLALPFDGFFDQSGAFLFYHTTGNIGVWTVDPSTGIPAQLPTTQGGTGNLPWGVTDPL